MLIFNKIIALSKQIASSILKDEQPTSLKDSEVFNESDKAYILKTLTSEYLIKERLELSNKIDKQKDWKKIKKEINTPIRKLYWYYSAAAIVIGILATTYYLERNSFNAPIENVPIIVDYNIKTGTDKATLTLGDGKKIVLEENPNFSDKNLTSNGKEIIYNAIALKNVKKTFNYLTIPRGGEYFIKLSDGTKVWLNSESQLKYPVNFIEGEIREVELVYGEAYFDVSPSSKHKGSKFKVVNQYQDVEVLGTEFNIKAYKEEKNIFTTLVEGKITVSNFISKQNLVPNQQTKISIKNKSITIIDSINVYNEIAWKKGLFSFKSKPLNEIMVVLSRWYDFEVIFENKELEKVKFNGVLSKKDNIEEILTTIINSNFINTYDITEKKITIK